MMVKHISPKVLTNNNNTKDVPLSLQTHFNSKIYAELYIAETERQIVLQSRSALVRGCLIQLPSKSRFPLNYSDRQT